jgi:sodium transport system ATP-binding protein
VERLCDEVVVVAGGRTVASGSVASLCAHTGHADFEDAFVALAFPDAIALPARLEEAA